MGQWSIDHPRLWLVLMIAALLSLLPLAWLQYRWIGQVSADERERRQRHLEIAVARFVRDLDGELGRLIRLLLSGRGPGPGGNPPDLTAPLTRFLEAGGELRLIRNLYFSEGGQEGTRELHRMDPASGRVTPVTWPPELVPLRAHLEQLARSLASQPAPFQPAFANRGVTFFAPRWQLPPGGFFPERRPSPRPATLAGWSVIELDLDFISKELLPELVRRHFLESGEPHYQVRIVSQAETESTIYATDTSLPASLFSSPDASAPLLSMRPERGLRFSLALPGQPPFAARLPGPPWQPADAPPQEPAEARGLWRLQVRHPAGSLEAAVAATRRRNLSISLAILLLMTGSLAGLLVWTRRAQKLARMQMEFVAGVSHELRTPLSVICSAGDNLADGLVSAPPQVRRYGAVIRGEGRRLSQMVERILGFAGIQSGRVHYELQPVDVEKVVTEAVAACEPDIRAAGCTLETQIDSDLPQILADSTSLIHSLRNLIDNALTHGREGQWIGVRARAAETNTRHWVEIVVADRGRGIDPRELQRLFDPFYRGRRAITEQVRGSGLGLTLARRIVQAHSGTLTADSTPGMGARFIVRLPALAPAALEEEDGEPTDSAHRG